ncbi:MAG: PIN domain-containing protein [Thermoplasmata archaeon]
MLLDANALLLPIRTLFPLESEVDRIHPGARLVVPSSVIDELDRLVARGVPGARGALALAQKFLLIPVEGRGDAAILKAAMRHSAWVVTADRALAERLRKEGVTVLAPRDRHRLELHRGRSPAPSPPPSGVRREPAHRRQRL